MLGPRPALPAPVLGGTEAAVRATVRRAVNGVRMSLAAERMAACACWPVAWTPLRRAAAAPGKMGEGRDDTCG